MLLLMQRASLRGCNAQVRSQVRTEKGEGMFDHSRLKGLMREKHMSQEDLAKSMGISATSLWNKLNNRSDFSTKEMFVIMRCLEIEDPVPYFFDCKVGKSQR